MEHNLAAYRAFYETAKEGNISKAATKLGVTQPAVSRAISKLEQNFGTKLFNRTQRGVSLTPEGDIFYEHLEQAFYDIEKGEEELRRIKDDEFGYLKIGSSSTLCRFFLVSYLKEFFDRNPFVKLTIENASTAQTIQRIQSRKLDIGAVMLYKKEPDIVFEKIMDVEDIFVCTPLYKRRLEELYGTGVNPFEKANIMLLSREHVTRKYIDEFLKSENISPKRLLEFRTIDVLIDMAKSNMGVACVIREFVTRELAEGTLSEIPLPRRIPKRMAGFAYLESDQNPALREFLRCIK